jgi:hypothetical protein
MTVTHDSEGTPLERIEDLPRILKAMKEAVREAVLRHKLLGSPVAVWQDGRVVWLAPEEIRPEIFDTSREAGSDLSRAMP